IKTSGKGIENAILELFGKNVLKGLKKFEYGYLGTIDLLRSTKDYIFTYVNKRYVKSNTIERAVVDGYYTKLMKGKYPFAIVFMDIDPREIDVNVHPSKKIIKFSNEKMAYSMIKNPIDEFFYTEERESWQPNVDLLKQNVNVENPDEKIKDLFTGEMIKGETPKFFSFETHDGKNGSKTLEPFEVKEELARPVNRVDEINEIIKQMTKELEVEESKTDQQVYKKGTFEYGTENINTSENSVTSVGKEYKILGQLFNMYILVSEGETLQIYDQHIIHERILYEELKDKFYAKKMDSQQLLVPQKMEINQVDKGILLENIAVFQEFGFDIDEFSENEIIFRAVPTFDFRDTIENVFKKLLEDLKKDLEIKDLRERIIISMSCKGAIKAGQKLEMHEMERMVKRLHEVGKYTCPHGRPIIVNITKDDLDKMFGRKK
nr:DNA mismatch repair protein MutL [Leptotrichiaceae bacterium]